jgi:putative integral membrane protein (TIGR02587 family)
LGVGVARLLLHGEPGVAEDDDPEPEAKTTASNASRMRTSIADIGATALGAAFIGMSIAPTDEVPMIASAMSPGWVVLLVGASLTISYAVVFVAGFSGQDRRHRQRGVFQRPLTETLVTYLVALTVAAILLWVFQRDLSPPPDLLVRVVVLSLPAAVGGAVGRLAI